MNTAIYAQEEKQDPVKELEQQTQLLQDDIKSLKQFMVSGYVQTQFQYGEKNASLKVGSVNTDLNKDFSRFGIRRGRIKFQFERGIALGVFQLDMTDKGVSIKDAYLNVKIPRLGNSSIKAGIFDRPFGYEIAYSSSRRESPERATVITTLFPDERDLGLMLTLQAPKTSSWNFLKLEAALVSGNSIKLDMDNRKDFIGHLSANKNINEKYNISGGISYYKGSTYQGSSSVYKMNGNKFEGSTDTSHFGAFANREYIGVDAQFATITSIGTTQLYGEFLTGVQPGDKSSSKSPNYSTLPTNDTYIRNFTGGYITLAQDLGKVPLVLVLKYDNYDPNSKVSKNDIGLNGTGKGDIAYQTIGTGLIWKINNTMRLTGYYDWIKNETSTLLKGYDKDIADNAFTLRFQYKF
ncbi:MAG: phosphate-selective porin O and P [Bacteroidetes bacterium OLB11]|nr:MAG: phosphate-selective porin O and P [Bacteroidetes bacterium OLB11]